MNEKWTALWSDFKANLGFIGIALAISVGLVLLAWLAEKLSKKPEGTEPPKLRRLTVTALCAALAAVLMLFDIPLYFAPSFYKMDFSELPVLFCGFALGPVAGIVCEFLKVLLKTLIKGTSTAFVGEFSNFVLGCAMILPAAVLYRFRKTRTRALWGMILGTVTMTVFGSLFNAFYLIPQYARLFGMSVETIVSLGTKVNPFITDVRTLVLFAVVPFNLIKGLLVSAITFFIYKFVKKILIGH